MRPPLALAAFLMTTVAATAAAGQTPPPTAAAADSAKVIFDSRVRYESVDQDGLDRATAVTARTRLGWRSERRANLQFLIEGEAVGALGQLFPGDLTPEVERALVALSPGQVGGEPIRSRFGWHILRLDRRQAGRRLPFEHVHADIADQLRHRAWAGAAARYVAALADDARESGVALTLDEMGDVAPGALSFGDLMGDGEALALRSERWLASADPDLAELARAEAERRSQPLSAFVRETLAAFLAKADDEAWTRLISVAQGADDPALACAQSILRHTLVKPAKTFTLIRRR